MVKPIVRSKPGSALNFLLGIILRGETSRTSGQGTIAEWIVHAPVPTRLDSRPEPGLLSSPEGVWRSIVCLRTVHGSFPRNEAMTTKTQPGLENEKPTIRGSARKPTAFGIPP